MNKIFLSLSKKTIFISAVFILLPFVCFAAIVSDNDGAAFVTKAEFESLKSNFAEQVDNYSDSIEKKIDGAIASYLAGMRIETKENIDSILNKINDACTDSYVSGGVEKNMDIDVWLKVIHHL